MTPVIWYQSEGYRTDVPKLMGRLAAGAGFLKGFAQHSRAERFVGLVRGPRERDEFVETMWAIRPDVPAVTIPLARIREVSQYGVLSYPAPIDARLAIARNFYGARAWSLSGVTHTISSSGIMDVVTRWLTTPMQPWDAVVCTSRAVVDAVEHMLEAEKEMLRERLGAQRFILPRLPVIPLGVDCDAQAVSAETRGKARSALSIAPDDLVVLFVGRLSFHAKANPAPMYLALERLAARRRVVSHRVRLDGQRPHPDLLAAACTALCPSVRSIVLDGREAANRTRAWGAADIFCSLSDNIQETFGLTPIEAMAAGLPSIVSDWNGYRDTVRDGLDGFAIPTLMPPPGAGQDLAIAHAVESDNYDAYIGRAALSIVVDVEGTSPASSGSPAIPISGGRWARVPPAAPARPSTGRSSSGPMKTCGPSSTPNAAPPRTRIRRPSSGAGLRASTPSPSSKAIRRTLSIRRRPSVSPPPPALPHSRRGSA